jgi:hypothetical protein
MKISAPYTIRTVMSRGLEYVETYADGSAENWFFDIERKSGVWIVLVPPGRENTFEPSWTEGERERIAPRIEAYFGRPGCFGLIPASRVEFRKTNERAVCSI